MSQIGEEGLKKREENSQEAPDEQSVWIQFLLDVVVLLMDPSVGQRLNSFSANGSFLSSTKMLKLYLNDTRLYINLSNYTN